MLTTTLYAYLSIYAYTHIWHDIVSRYMRGCGLKIKTSHGYTQHALRCRSWQRTINSVMGDREGDGNKEHGMIYNEQYKHGGSMEYMETVSTTNTNTVAKSI